ncbi:MAG: hypothetical protein ACK5N8_04200 [Alphaproteobacteria bacterium]
MNKFFIMALSWVMFSASVVMAEEEKESLFEIDNSLEEALETNQPEGVVFSVKEVEMPKCHDENLRQKVVKLISDYQENNKEITILGKRNQFLILKRLSDFEPVYQEKIDNKKDFELANEVIKTKINLGVDAENIQICRCTKNIDGKDLYVLMYKKDNKINGKVINFTTEGINVDQLSFEIGAD